MVTVGQLGCDLDRAFKPGKGPDATGAKSPPDPESDHVARETADPADHNERAEAQRARMRGVPREQCKQQAMRSSIGEHDAVGRIAVLAYEFEKRVEVRREQQGGAP